MLFRDILLHYVDVDGQRNPIKNTAAEKRALENQQIKNFIIIFFYLYPDLFLTSNLPFRLRDFIFMFLSCNLPFHLIRMPAF